MEELLSHYGPGPSSKRMRRNECTRDDRASCPEYRARESITERSEPASAINSSSNDETERSSLTRSLARPREDHPDGGGDLHRNGSSDWGSSPTFLQPDDRVAASLVHYDDLSSAHTVSPEQPECNADSPPHSTPSISISDEIHDDALQSGATTQGEDVSWHDEAESLSPLPRHQKRSKGYLYAADDAVVYDLELAFHCQRSRNAKSGEFKAWNSSTQSTTRRKSSTAVLAALIVSNWAGRQEGLVSVLEEEFAGGKGAKAEGLATLLEQNEEKAKELKTLEKQRDDQAELVRSLPPAATGAGRALRFKKLRALSAVLSKKRADKAHLEDEFEKALQSLMQADDKARKLVQDALGTFASS
ncbi:hypothetical protein ON010_g5402 [Phytophthora cinnamomi]|nr:hypothetical protein ON010_g5402 [Phytophthora cinnamomi]